MVYEIGMGKRWLLSCISNSKLTVEMIRQNTHNWAQWFSQDTANGTASPRILLNATVKPLNS
uniref:Uncharacterized protein n=1 Tax=Anguilla anguilla TaxID=7936 RepID=A0A0E9SQM9_ANGAN